MYKLIRQVPAASRRLVLISNHRNGPCSLFVIHGERKYSSESDLPKRKSRKLFWSIAGVTIFTGTAVVFAKENPDFRKWLATNAPWADSLVTIVYQENGTVTDWAHTQWNSVSKSTSELIFGKEEGKKLTTPPSLMKSGIDDKQSLAPIVPKKVEEKKEIPQKGESSTPPTPKQVKSDPIASVSSPKLPDMVDVTSLEKSVQYYTNTAINNFNKAIDACAEYNQILNKIVEASVDQLDKKKFDLLRKAQATRQDVIVAAETASKQAEAALDELAKLVSDADASTKRGLSRFKSELSAAKEEFRGYLEASGIADRYWQKVEMARQKYTEELQALFPSVDIEAQRLSMAGGDLDLLLVHTLRQVSALQKELAEAQTIREQRLKRAIESRDDKELIEAKVAEILAKERLDLEQDYQRKSLKTLAEAERAKRDELKKQLELHQEHLRDKLAAKEKEVSARFDALVSESVEKHRLVFAQQLAEVRAKLHAIEDNLKARAGADATARRAQSLWATAESLMAATRGAADKASVADEVKALEKVGGDDELVQGVTKAISPSIRNDGVLTEIALKEKYLKMEKTALRVALVSDEHASLPVYFLSFLQSLLLFKTISDIPQKELENQPTDFSNMDAYDILQRSRYWMERGDIATAVRYVNLLRGASRTAAQSWRDAAVRHLELKAAAEAVMAHAAAASIHYI